MRCAVSFVLGAGLVVGMAAHAHADDGTLVDTLGPREIAVGEALRGGATGASAIALNPAGLALNKEVVFEGGYGYRSDDDASLVGVSACDSTAGMPGCFFYNYAATNPDSTGMSLHTSTQLGGIALAKAITPRFYVGAVGRYFHVDSDVSNMTSSGFNFDLGAELRLTDFLSFGVSGQNLYGDSSPDLPRAAGGGLFIQPLPAVRLGFDMRWRLEGTQQGVRYGGGAELFIKSSSGQTGVPIRVGALHDDGLDATYVSGGLGIATMKLDVDVGARRAISGPADTVILASMRLFGPRMPAPAME